MKLMTVLLICFSIFAWSKNENKIDKNIKSRLPNQIVPLDNQTEKMLKASNLAAEVTEYDSEQKAFHRKAYLAFEKISPLISLKGHDSLDYVYDCLFMIEEGFYLKYSKLPKDKLTTTRKIVNEVFEK